MWNVHIMFITYIDNIGISRYEKHLTSSLFRYETFYYLWIKRFFDNLSMTTFPSALNYVRHPVSSESQPFSSDAKTRLPNFSQISAHASGAWRHPNTLVPISIWDFYFDISEWHILPACAGTPALVLHLTNPCAKWKILSLTKPKGKTYKTKSLSHYITVWIGLF